MAPTKRIAVHGHRGARARFPENTMAGFCHAIEAGADYLELDLMTTRDHVLVVTHDPVLNPRLCTAPSRFRVCELTFADLRRWDFGARANRRFPLQAAVPGSRIPSLEEVLHLAGRTGIQLTLEVKSFPDPLRYGPPPEHLARLLLETLRAHGRAERVIVESFDFRVLRALNELAPSLRLGALYGPGLRDLTAIAREAGVGIVAPHHRLATRRRVRTAHAAGLEVIAWTANTPRIWDRLIRAGVDGIITDDPAALIKYLKEKGLR